MDPGSILLVSSATASSLLMIYTASRSRPRRGRRLLGAPLEGFKPLARPSLDKTFRVQEELLPGYEGEWRCGLLGCGGWGCTYLCTQDSVEAAFKVPNRREYREMIETSIPPTILEAEKAMEDVAREAEAIGGLRHPHLLRLLAYSRHVPLLVYEYADMGTLAHQQGQGWSPRPGDVALIGYQLADALRYIHSRGLIHGDIKPSNVLISQGVVKLGDFSSISSLLGKFSITGIRSTPGWRAPEQVYSDLRRLSAERGLENRIDVYQLGNLLLYLETGATLDGEHASTRKRQEVLKRIRDRELRGIVQAMLEPDPARRLSSEEAARLLGELVGA
ncbi:MAG: protein kinase [Desulfurococcales archaeon]|nr:protein kinase [Desulfurococcales archaeon]